MNTVLLAGEEDRRGFALAGLAGPACRDRAAMDAALGALSADPEVGLLLVTAEVARLAPRALEDFRRRAGAPLVLVLPEPEAADVARRR